jgi:hypothetical protein
MKLIDKASGGQIVVDQHVKKEAETERFRKIGPKAWRYLGTKKGYRIPSRPKKTVVGGSIPSDILQEKLADLSSYVPSWVFKRLKMKPVFDQKDGEHRKVAIAFVHFGAVPYDKNPHRAAQVLEQIYEAFTDTIAKYDGWLNKIDVYRDSARALVVFGFPLAHEDCEQRATLFAYDIMRHPAMKDRNVRISVNAGFVFAVPVGSELRREYTVMGDTVNIAARLAGVLLIRQFR